MFSLQDCVATSFKKPKDVWTLLLHMIKEKNRIWMHPLQLIKALWMLLLILWSVVPTVNISVHWLSLSNSIVVKCSEMLPIGTTDQHIKNIIHKTCLHVWNWSFQRKPAKYGKNIQISCAQTQGANQTQGQG